MGRSQSKVDGKEAVPELDSHEKRINLPGKTQQCQKSINVVFKCELCAAKSRIYSYKKNLKTHLFRGHHLTSDEAVDILSRVSTSKLSLTIIFGNEH